MGRGIEKKMQKEMQKCPFHEYSLMEMEIDVNQTNAEFGGITLCPVCTPYYLRRTRRRKFACREMKGIKNAQR